MKQGPLRWWLLIAVFVTPAIAGAQEQPGAHRQYPSLWLPLLKKLTKDDVDLMQESANEYCRELDYKKNSDLYNDVGSCTLMQATAIMSVDSSLVDFEFYPATKYRSNQVKKCWVLYHALGSKDVENLSNSFGAIEGFELLQHVAAPKEPVRAAVSSTSAYCRKVADAAGGSYMILEECVKEERAAKRRLGQ